MDIECSQHEQVLGRIASERGRRYMTVLAVLFQHFQCAEFDICAIVQIVRPGIEWNGQYSIFKILAGDGKKAAWHTVAGYGDKSRVAFGNTDVRLTVDCSAISTLAAISAGGRCICFSIRCHGIEVVGYVSVYQMSDALRAEPAVQVSEFTVYPYRLLFRQRVHPFHILL